MRTLLQSVATGFMQQGIEPRLFVRVFDSAGVTVLCQGTKATGDYEDRITTFGVINQSIDPAGGMAEVSGASVGRLVLDERLTLCTEAEIAPEPYGATAGAGRLIRVGAESESYSDVRNAAAANDFAPPAIAVGRRWDVGNVWFSVFRGYAQFAVPAGLTSCEDAYIALVGAGDYSDVDFTVQIVAGTWADLSEGTGMFDAFAAWEASGDYDTLVNLAETWTPAEYGATVYVRFNAAGRAAVLAAAGGTLKLLFLSSKDATWTGNEAGPAGDEFVMFGSSTVRLVLRYNSVTLDNKGLEFLYGLETLPATVSGSTIDRVWSGVVDTWRLNDREMTATGRQNDHKKNPLVPEKIITTAIWPDCPEENLGKPYPIAVGDFYSNSFGTHSDGIGIDSAGGLTGLRNYAPGIIVKPWGASYEDPGEILIAGHAVSNSIVGLPALWNSTMKKFERFWAQNAGTEPHTASDGAIFLRVYPKLRALTDNSGLVLSWHEYVGRAFSCIPSRVVRYLATDPEYAFSGTSVQYALLNGTNAFIDFGFDQMGAFAEREQVEVVFDLVMTGTAGMTVTLYDVDTNPNVTGTNGVTSLGIVDEIYFDSAGATFQTASVAADDLLVITEGINAGEWPIDSVISQTRLEMKWMFNDPAITGQIYKILHRGAVVESVGGGTITGTGQKIVPLSLFAEDPAKYVLRLAQVSGAGSFQVKNLQIRVFSPDALKPGLVWQDIEGAVYGSWITGRGFTSGALVENPAGVIEWFARNEMGLVAAEIDTAAFDTAAAQATITGKKLAFNIRERKPARELLDDMARQARLLLWWDEQDRLTVKYVDSTAAFPHSTTDVPGDRDIFSVTGAPSGGYFTQHQIIEGPSIYPVDADKVYNDFVIKYRKNYATGDYAAVLTCNKDAENLDETILAALGTTGAELVTLCDDCYDRTLKVNTLEIEAWAIRDEATATALMQHIVQWYTKTRIIIEFTAGISALEFEPGDFINVRDARIEDLYGTAVMNVKKWMIQKHDPDLNNQTFHIEAIEVGA